MNARPSCRVKGAVRQALRVGNIPRIALIGLIGIVALACMGGVFLLPHGETLKLKPRFLPPWVPLWNHRFITK